MKKSLLNKIIREEVMAAMKEASNPELDRTISQFVAGLAKKYSYQQSDAVMAIFEAMKRLGLINKNTNYMAADGLSEGLSSEDGYSIHAMVGGGQDRAQDFIDDNNIDAQKLIDYIKQNIRTNPAIKYDVRDYISGASGTVGAEKNLRDKFIKQFQKASPLKEYTKNNFQATVPGSGRPKIDPALFAKLMPKSAKTSKEAEARIKMYNGSTMFVHSQYFVVTPNGNMPNKPKYRIHQLQYYNNDYNAPANLKGQDVNVTFLTIFDVTNGEVELGVCYVDTKVFLAECKVLFQVIKSVS